MYWKIALLQSSNGDESPGKGISEKKMMQMKYIFFWRKNSPQKWKKKQIEVARLQGIQSPLFLGSKSTHGRWRMCWASTLAKSLVPYWRQSSSLKQQPSISMTLQSWPDLRFNEIWGRHFRDDWGAQNITPLHMALLFLGGWHWRRRLPWFKVDSLMMSGLRRPERHISIIGWIRWGELGRKKKTLDSKKGKNWRSEGRDTESCWPWHQESLP